MAHTPRDIVDMVTRDLARVAPAGFFALAGLPAPTGPVRYEDISVIAPEMQADKVLVVDGPSPYALYPEFQTRPPDEDAMQLWPVKQIILSRRLKMPVCLVVFYLHRGDRATFPDSYVLGLPPLQSRFHFPVIFLWEREEEIREHYPELAILLLVTAQEPTDETLREVKQLIDRVEGSVERRDNLYGLAAMLGMHFFEEALVRVVFGEKFEEIKKMGVIDRWLEEKYQEGVYDGINQGAREVVLRLLADKFGPVPQDLAQRVQQADAEWCQRLSLIIVRARTLEEIDLS